MHNILKTLVMNTILHCKKCNSNYIERVNRTKIEKLLSKITLGKSKEKRKYKCLSCLWVGFITIKV